MKPSNKYTTCSRRFVFLCDLLTFEKVSYDFNVHRIENNIYTRHIPWVFVFVPLVEFPFSGSAEGNVDIAIINSFESFW